MSLEADSFLEDLWDGLLSREPEKIRRAYNGLDAGEKQSVLVHLNRMVSEEGWHPEQRVSAQAALDALEADASSGLT